MALLFLCVPTILWNKVVFLSPSFNHISLEFCLQLVPSIRIRLQYLLAPTQGNFVQEEEGGLEGWALCLFSTICLYRNKQDGFWRKAVYVELKELFIYLLWSETKLCMKDIPSTLVGLTDWLSARWKLVLYFFSFFWYSLFCFFVVSRAVRGGGIGFGWFSFDLPFRGDSSLHSFSFPSKEEKEI